MGGERETEREILPGSLQEFYIEARKNTFASGEVLSQSPTLPYSKELSYQKDGYCYKDIYFDESNRAGNFGGIEIIRRNSFGNRPLTVYTYAGGLTKKGLELGERMIYKRLQTVLKEHCARVRFGRDIFISTRDDEGVWDYISEGRVADWGWQDREWIYCNGELVYGFSGQGICFLPGF